MGARSPRNSNTDSFVPTGRWREWLIASGLAAVAIIVYLPTLRFDFVGWDDTRYITDSPLMTQPGGLLRIWASQEPEQYYPLTFTTYWLEYRLWKDEPTGYHSTNILLHAANVMLLFFFLMRLGRQPVERTTLPCPDRVDARRTEAPPDIRFSYWGAIAVCLLFALHPVQVQSVAWIAERKNLLSSFFLLASLIAWSRFRQGIGRSWYFIGFTWFVAALLSKSAVLTLPLALAALDRWVWKVSWRRILADVGPCIIPAAVLAFATVSFEVKFADQAPDWSIRPLIASAALGFYVLRLIAPVHLLPMYPQWEVAVGSIAWWLPPAALLTAMVACWRTRRTLDGITAYGLIHFVVFLIPVLGLIAYGNLALTCVSDHYLYLPCIGLFAVVALLLQRIRDRSPGSMNWITGIGVVVLLAAAVTTARYLPTFANGEAMWNRTLAGNPLSPAAHAGLGRAYEDQQLWDKALEHYQRAAAIAPHLEVSLDMARILRHLGRREEAVRVLLSTRHAYAPSTAPIVELARMAQQAGKFDQAEEWFREALAEDSENASIHAELAALYLGLFRREDAETHFREAIKQEPRNARAYLGLATSLRGQQRFEEAIKALRAGLEAVPHDISLTNLLARTLATCPDDRLRNGAEAVALAELSAAAVREPNYELLDTLAAAHAEVGNWERAASIASKARQQAQLAGDTPFAELLGARIDAYRSGNPLREITTTPTRK